MLSQFLIGEIFTFLLIFCRVGAAIMLLPGFGEAYVMPRMRLFLALILSIILTPVIAMPPVPATTPGLVTLIVAEILVGLFLGAMTRMLIAAIHMAGMIIAFQSSLASVLVQDVSQAQGQASALSNFLSVAALILLFSLDLHHLMLRGLADSYSLFLPGHFPMVEDFAEHAAQTINRAFLTAMQLAAPHIVVGVLLYLGAGILARLVPTIPVFFVLIPPHLLISFFILMVCFSTIMAWYMEYFQDGLGRFLAP